MRARIGHKPKMKLAEYMSDHGLDDVAFARRMGPECSPWAVRKWRYAQRVPRANAQLRIGIVTKGAVTSVDLVDAWIFKNGKYGGRFTREDKVDALILTNNEKGSR